MGAGYHGGFGATKGSRRVIVADSSLVGNGRGDWTRYENE